MNTRKHAAVGAWLARDGVLENVIASKLCSYGYAVISS